MIAPNTIKDAEFYAKDMEERNGPKHSKTIDARNYVKQLKEMSKKK